MWITCGQPINDQYDGFVGNNNRTVENIVAATRLQYMA